MTYLECLLFLEKVRWRGIPVCPYCKTTNSTPLPQEQRHHCNECNTSYSVTVNTIFHGSHLSLEIWFRAIYFVLSDNKKISGRRLGRSLDINKNTACSMFNRIHIAMHDSCQRKILISIADFVSENETEIENGRVKREE